MSANAYQCPICQSPLVPGPGGIVECPSGDYSAVEKEIESLWSVYLQERDRLIDRLLQDLQGLNSK